MNNIELYANRKLAVDAYIAALRAARNAIDTDNALAAEIAYQNAFDTARAADIAYQNALTKSA